MSNKWDMIYSAWRVGEAAKSFRRLADTYNELAFVRSNEYKSAIVMQLVQMAAILESFTDDEAVNRSITSEERKRFIKLLKTKGVVVTSATFLERDKKYDEIILNAYFSKKKCMTSRELAGIISDYFEKRYIASDNSRMIINNKPDEYTFVTAPQFKSICEVSQVSKKGNRLSGDSFSMSRLGCGKEVVCIVDGMGSGVMANHDSKIVIELLEQFLEAGFSEQAAINMINAAFSVNDYVGNPITLDMCVMDMYLGVCNCIKLGAVSTFIKRNGWVEIIKSTTLPMGVFEHVDYDDTVKKLYDGDVIVMVSDGVIEAFDVEDKEEMLVNIISEISGKNPKRIADTILEKALESSKGEALDDMTVVVVMVNFDKN